MDIPIVVDRRSVSLWRGFARGLIAPFSASEERGASVAVDPELLTNSYRPPSEDRENIRRYFDAALGNASAEVEAKSNRRK